jgi:hypothetical protein
VSFLIFLVFFEQKVTVSSSAKSFVYDLCPTLNKLIFPHFLGSGVPNPDDFCLDEKLSEVESTLFLLLPHGVDLGDEKKGQ